MAILPENVNAPALSAACVSRALQPGALAARYSRRSVSCSRKRACKGCTSHALCCCTIRRTGSPVRCCFTLALCRRASKRRPASRGEPSSAASGQRGRRARTSPQQALKVAGQRACARRPRAQPRRRRARACSEQWKTDPVVGSRALATQWPLQDGGTPEERTAIRVSRAAAGGRTHHRTDDSPTRARAHACTTHAPRLECTIGRCLSLKLIKH